MDYDFTNREREFGQVVFALTLDKERMTERVVIGRTDGVRNCLERGAGEVYYDAVRPLGSLLLNFESGKNGEWNKHAMILRESYAKVFPFEPERWKTAAPVSGWLKARYDSGEPTAMFAAIRTWEEYLNCYSMNHGADLLTDRLFMLYKPFHIYAGYKPWRDEAIETLNHAVRDGESNVELWYLEQPEDMSIRLKSAHTKKKQLEIIVASTSFLPVIFYYLHKIEEWGYVFQRCKVCGAHFLARSRHFELCSDKCRKAQAVEAKRGYDERTKGDRLEQLDESAYNYWYNRLRKLKKGDAANSEKASVVKTEFNIFRKEAIRRKNMVKNGDMTISEFAGWLVKQQDVVDNLMGELNQKLLCR
jgi:hypothetical protein